MSSSLIGKQAAKPFRWATFKRPNKRADQSANQSANQSADQREGRVNLPHTVAATLILTGILALALPSEAANKQPVAHTKGSVSTSEFSIAGLSFYASEDEILAILGSPKSRELAPTTYIDEVLYYGGISIAVTGGQVWDIIATSPKFCTPSGVCPGDSVDYVFNILGPTDITQYGGMQTAVYTAPDMDCSLNLDIVADAVSQIKLTCP